MNEIVAIPRHTKQGIVQSLRALRERQALTEVEADEVLDWLRETAIPPLRCWVGELAAFLLRDHAGPRVKARVWTLCQRARSWKLYFYLIVLMSEKNQKRLKPHLRRALRSKETVIRAFAEHLLWDRQEPSRMVIPPQFAASVPVDRQANRNLSPRVDGGSSCMNHSPTDRRRS